MLIRLKTNCCCLFLKLTTEIKDNMATITKNTPTDFKRTEGVVKVLVKHKPVPSFKVKKEIKLVSTPAMINTDNMYNV